MEMTSREMLDAVDQALAEVSLRLASGELDGSGAGISPMRSLRRARLPAASGLLRNLRMRRLLSRKSNPAARSNPDEKRYCSTLTVILCRGSDAIPI
jgi:hypothetical protein